jgi:hypothetical protein
MAGGSEKQLKKRNDETMAFFGKLLVAVLVRGVSC